MPLIGSFLVGISKYGPKAGKIKTSLARVPYNKVLSNLACSSRTGNIGLRSIFCTDLAAISPLAALGPYWHDLYYLVRPSRSVGKRVIFFFCYLSFFFPRCEPRACFFSFCWNGICDKNYDRNVKCVVHSSFVALSHRNQRMI